MRTGLRQEGAVRQEGLGVWGIVYKSHAQVMAKTTRQARWMEPGSRERDVGLTRAESLDEGKERAYV